MIFNEYKTLASLVRDSFPDFVKEFWGTIVHEDLHFNWHMDFICRELQEAAERVFRGEPKKFDYVINVPPGSSKSTISSQMFVAWVWTRMPTARFICTSYSHPIALKDSRFTRDIIQSELYQTCFPEIQLREDQNTKGLFMNTLGGERFSAGMGGGVTGNHAHFLIVDDPINPEEAFSEAELKAANRWMEQTLPTRKVDKLVTPTILIQQRLHQADPSGEMVEKGQERGGIRHICLPGEDSGRIFPPELKAHYKDGLLDPVRLPAKVLEELKEILGEYGYAAQILQHPVPLGGGMFKVEELSLRDVAPRMVRLVRSWDKAGSKDKGAYSAGVLCGVDKENYFWILDVVRGQWAAAEREKTIRQTAELDCQEYGSGVEIFLEIEGGSGGKESYENTVRNLAGFKVFGKHPTGDKEARAYAFASQVGIKDNVRVLNRDWTRKFIEELRFFPFGKYKDQTDAAAAGYNRMARKPKRVGGIRSLAGKR